MSRSILLWTVALSLIIHIVFICSFPLTADELNIFNIYFIHSPDFSSFWHYFIQYDTHQPLFHVLWYWIFNPKYSEFIFRLPSLIFYSLSILIWKDLFSYRDIKNIIPWVLFLFCPFVIIYSGLFLPYSLLILFSLLNYKHYISLEKEFSLKHVVGFFTSSILLIFTHYYGALQAVLLGVHLIYISKSIKLKILTLMGLVIISLLLIMTTDFINDFSAIHNYRKTPGILNILGDLNLLVGGRFNSLIIVLLLIVKKKFSILKSREFIFIIVVILIAFLKSILISPSFEARYLLILLYPLYFLFKDLQIKTMPVALVFTSMISFYILEKNFSHTFVINYKNIEKKDLVTAVLVTPCPKFYFQEDNYSCINEDTDTYRLPGSFDRFLVHSDHFENFKKTVSKAICSEKTPGLYDCSIPKPTH